MASSRKPKGYDDLAREVIKKLMGKKATKEALEASAKRVSQIDRKGAEAAARRATQNKTKASVQNRIRLVEVSEAKSGKSGEGYNSYMEAKKGKKPPTGKQRAEASIKAKKVQGGMKKEFTGQSAKQAELRKATKSGTPEQRRAARQKLRKHEDKYGRFGK
jgi:hypothetical protein